MKLKKFTAPTLKEATEAMRTDLGESAIILHTKKLTGELTGNENYEITAAIDNDPLELNTGSFEGGEIPELTTLDNLKKIAEKFQNSREEKVSRDVQNDKSSELLNLKSELNSVKGTLGEIADRLKSDKLPELPKQLRDLYNLLVNNEIDEKNARNLVYEISEALNFAENVDDELINNILIKKISEKIIIASPLKISHTNSKVITFIGPTGVGKTTTICKIAAVCKYFNHYNVAIISVDTYRLAAIDQLKTFTDIANIPLEIAYTADELNEMIGKHKDKEVIFIDTVGRSPNNAEHIADLKQFVESTSSDEVHLIISASTGLAVMKETVKSFGTIMPNRLIISKIDEAVHFGNILNIIDFSHIPLSYITTGQVIPDDIEAADKNKLSGLILKSKENDEWSA
jgi:flagellar biosynthesis protein FlhF